MRHKLFSRRRAVGFAAIALGLSGMSLVYAGAAGADTLPNATEMTGSGSNTAYAMMVQEADLFNSSPGCDLAGSGADSLNLNCGTDPSDPNSTTAGENGYEQAVENPYNDYSVEAPAVGSGNGVNQLNSTAGFQPAYARSSGSPSSSNGTSAQNYIAYAVDGVDWTAFQKSVTSGVTTDLPAFYVKTAGLSQTQIKDIWAGDLPACTIGKASSGTLVHLPEQTWGCLFKSPTGITNGSAEQAAAEQHIDCYIAQPGSGTAGTWATFAGYTKSSTTTGCLLNESGPGVVGGATQTGDTCDTAAQAQADHFNLFENEMSQIANLKCAGSSSLVNDQKNAIYFFSFGRFRTLCNPPGGKGDCPDTKVGSTQYVSGLGYMDDAITNTPELPSQGEIQGNGGGVYTSHKWPVLRNLFNVYNNSTAPSQSPALPEVNQATLNFVGEYGFLCKPITNADVDPLTGVAYRTEIENDISAQGFFPLDTSGTPFQEEASPSNVLTNPGTITSGSAYATVDPTSQGSVAGNGTGPNASGDPLPLNHNGIPSGDTSTVSDPYGYCLPQNG